MPPAPRRPRPPAGPTPPSTPGERFRGLLLNDFQLAALEPLRAGRSVLLAAPTGSGKTLVAEIAIDLSIRRGRRAIYTAPIKALSNQKFRDFKAIAPEGVGIMTGDVTINPGAPLLIMTTEIFRNTIFENPAGLGEVETVVFDEIHYMDDLERGTVWEESIIFAPPHIRFVCLSATISNLDQFGEWIGQTRGQPVEVLRHRERPVPLDHYLFLPGGGLRRIEKSVALPRLPSGGRNGRFGRAAPRRGEDRNAIVALLERQTLLPTLFFCFSRARVRAAGAARWRVGGRWSSTRRPTASRRCSTRSCDTFEITPDRALEEQRSLVRHGSPSTTPECCRCTRSWWSGCSPRACCSCCSRPRPSASASTCRRTRWSSLRCASRRRRLLHAQGARVPADGRRAGRQGLDARGPGDLDPRGRPGHRRAKSSA
jgi:ATP-dependent RNA helicase HelY